MFDRAVTGPLKSNLLIHFAYADFEEVTVCISPAFIKLLNASLFRYCGTNNKVYSD